MKKIFLATSFLISSVFAFNVTPYTAFISYGKQTDKKSANVLGVYMSKAKNQYKFENDLEYLILKYNTTPDYKELDWTMVLNYYKGYNYQYKIGIHNIFSSTPETQQYLFNNNVYERTKYVNNYDFVLITGFMYYEYLKKDAGVDFYYSSYTDTKVFQISPYYGFDFGNYYSTLGSFYFKTKFNFIYITDNVAPKKNYADFDFKLQNFNGDWSTTLKASIGKSAYKVANGGFVVYNLGEEYNDVYSLEIGKKLDKNNYVSATFGLSDFTDSSGEKGDSKLLILNYSHNF